MIGEPFATAGFTSFCAGLLAYDAEADNDEASKRELAENLVQRAVNGGKTCIFLADMNRPEYGYSGAYSWNMMDWFNENDVVRIRVTAPVQFVGGRPYYPKGTLEVQVKQVLITEPWINKNSNNEVRACIVVIDYDARNVVDIDPPPEPQPTPAPQARALPPIADAVGPFRVGDRVRRIDNNSIYIPRGEERTVSEVLTTGIRVEGLHFIYSTTGFELVSRAVPTPPPPREGFQVGDRVRIHPSSTYYNNIEWPTHNPTDVTGTVDRMYDYGTLNIGVMWDGVGHNSYSAEDLMHYQEEG